MIKSISGFFFVIGENISLGSLKKKFGKGFKTGNETGSFVVILDDKTLDTLLNTLINNYQILIKSKVEKIIIYIDIAYKEQANWSVSPEQMNKLSFLNAALCVTAYEASDEKK